MRYTSTRRRGIRRQRFAGGFIIAIVAAVVAVLLAMLTLGYYDNDPVTFTMNGKESVATGHGDDRGHEYRVYTDRGTFVVKDSIIKWRFNSADVYGQLKVGTEYRCDSWGWRIPLFSSFKNIDNCKPLHQ